jgi:hypothetical protein
MSSFTISGLHVDIASLFYLRYYLSYFLVTEPADSRILSQSRSMFEDELELGLRNDRLRCTAETRLDISTA